MSQLKFQSVKHQVPTLLATLLGLMLAHFRAGDFEFFADDFVFLPLAYGRNDPLALSVTPLFGHFSPVAWILHWLVANSLSPATTVAVLVMSITATTSILVGILVKHLTRNSWIAAAASFLVAGSEVNVRTFNWWSAFAQDAPQVPLLLLTIFFYLRLGELGKKHNLNFGFFAFFGTLNLLSYELAILTPIFLICINALRSADFRVRGARPSLQNSALILISVLDLLVFITARVLTSAQTADFNIAAFMKYAFVFFANSFAILLSVPPISSWSWSGFAVLLFVGLLVAGINLRVRENLTFILALVLPYALTVALFSYSRSGFESESDYPGYPLDFQYHVLTNTWLVIGLLTVLSKVLGEKTSMRVSWILLLLLIASPAIFGKDPNGALSLNSTQRALVSNIRTNLENLKPGEFVINHQVPFVLAQFGSYSMLSSTVQVLQPDYQDRVFSGLHPYILDKETGKLVDSKSLPWVVGTSPEACQKATQVNGGWNLDIQQAGSGDLVLANIAGNVGQATRVSAILKTPEGDIETYGLGVLRTNETQIGFQIPFTPDSNRGVKSVTLVGLQVLSHASPEICLSGIRILPVSQ